MSDSLTRAAALGGFFAVVLDPIGPGWEPFPGDVEGRVDRLAARYATPIDQRAAASTDFLALAARVVSPPLATAVQDGTVPELEPQRLAVHRDNGSLGIAREGAEQPVERFAEAVVDTACAALVSAYAAVFRLSERILWGNVASALAGAATVLGGPDATAVVSTAITSGRLAGTGYYESARRFRRRSCCLYYRLPGGGLCGDCVLAGA